LIFAANLIDRVNNPTQFLNDVVNYIVPGGFLILLSPYTWLSEYTPKENWLGGKQVDGENVYTRQGLEKVLLDKFDMVSITIDGNGYEDPLYGFMEKGSS
jgi:hypothetical protein